MRSVREIDINYLEDSLKNFRQGIDELNEVVQDKSLRINNFLYKMKEKVY